jgi:hypothetical protein
MSSAQRQISVDYRPKTSGIIAACAAGGFLFAVQARTVLLFLTSDLELAAQWQSRVMAGLTGTLIVGAVCLAAALVAGLVALRFDGAEWIVSGLCLFAFIFEAIIMGMFTRFVISLYWAGFPTGQESEWYRELWFLCTPFWLFPAAFLVAFQFIVSFGWYGLRIDEWNREQEEYAKHRAP